MATQVDIKQTPHTQAQLAGMLVSALTAAAGSAPKRTLAELMLSQILMETANGTKIRNENVGNITAIEDQDYYVLSEANPLHFRSFDSLADGMAAFVHEIRRRSSMIQAGNAGDARAYVQAIRDTNYTPDIDVDSTTSTLQTYISGFRKSKLFDNLPSGSGLGKVFGVAALVVVGIVLKRRLFG